MGKVNKTDRTIVYVGGERGLTGDFPVAVYHVQEFGEEEWATEVVDPIMNEAVFNNLYGRMLTLVEATTDQSRLKAVKNLFAKEMNQWYTDVYTSAREIVNHNDSSHNIYTRRSTVD